MQYHFFCRRGKVNPVVKGEQLRIDVYDPKGAVFADNIGVAYFNGTFSMVLRRFWGPFIAILNYTEGLVQNYGAYKALITYNGQNVTIPFKVTPIGLRIISRDWGIIHKSSSPRENINTPNFALAYLVGAHLILIVHIN